MVEGLEVVVAAELEEVPAVEVALVAEPVVALVIQKAPAILEVLQALDLGLEIPRRAQSLASMCRIQAREHQAVRLKLHAVTRNQP